MSRILLIGRGPLPHPTQQQTGFAQLRTAHFLQALRQAGHAVDLLLVERDDDPTLIPRGLELARAADAVVSAGPHRPGALAARVVGDRPWWGDLPGDPLAELQALALALGESLPPARIAAAQAAAFDVLGRADALSPISARQRHATLGQLGLLGRGHDGPLPVHTVPIAYDLPLPAQAPQKRKAREPLVVALCGAFTPWLDDVGLAQALDRALAAHPGIQIRVSGGAVPGHYAQGHDRFRAWAEGSPHRDRIALLGWLPQAELVAALAPAQVGLCLDRPGSEPELGSRTRLLLYSWLGMTIATTPACELAAELCQEGLALSLPFCDPDGVAEALVGLAERPISGQRARAASSHLSHRYAADRIAIPLTRWAAAPTRRAPAHLPHARLSAEIESLRGQLAEIHSSPTWRTLSSIHRRIRGIAGLT